MAAKRGPAGTGPEQTQRNGSVLDPQADGVLALVRESSHLLTPAEPQQTPERRSGRIVVDQAEPLVVWLHSRVDVVARDVGALRRRAAASGSDYDRDLADRIAGHVETLDAVLQPTAGEVHKANRRFGAGAQQALMHALEDTDARAARLRGLLGGAA